MNLFAIVSLSVTICCFLLSIFVLIIGKSRLHHTWAFFNVVVGLWSLGMFFAASSQSSEQTLFYWKLAYLPGTFISIVFLHLVYAFCNFKEIRKLLILAYTQGIVFLFIILFGQSFFNSPRYVFNSFYYPRTTYLFILWMVLWLTTVYLAFYNLFNFIRKSKGTEKIKSAYLFWGTLLGFIGGISTILPLYNILLYPTWHFTICIYSIILTYAIFRHQLLGIEVAFRKGLLYSLLIGALTGIYLLVIMLTEWLFRGILGYKSLFISLSAAFIIAILFNPLRDKIQALVNKIFLGKTSEEISKENELLRQELERSERLKTAGTMALGLAHEIKNPLATIKTFSEFLPQKRLDDVFVEDFSRLVPAEVQRINNIVQNLLDFSKPSSPLLQEVNINEVISDILGISSSEFLKRKIEVIKSFDDSNPLIKADPNQIKQVIINLLFNAMEAMPKGGVITITTKRLKDTAVKIEISDTGCGIPQNKLKDIFNPFYTTKDSGTGLGLSIVHQIIKEHKGLIKVESEVGNGTRVIIEFY